MCLKTGLKYVCDFLVRLNNTNNKITIGLPSVCRYVGLCIGNIKLSDKTVISRKNVFFSFKNRYSIPPLWLRNNLIHYGSGSNIYSRGFGLQTLTSVLFPTLPPYRDIHTCWCLFGEQNEDEQPVKEGEVETASDENTEDDPKDRRKVIPPETSKRYMKSKAYEEMYGSEPVWTHYRRNFKGQYPPSKTRKTCINTDLLEQFISPHTGQVYDANKTGLCQKKQKELIVAVEKAKDWGLITFDVPFREYDYSEYYPDLQGSKTT
ncbi:mitochondrial ribosomal protein S18B isoform X2 [Tachypleus tridentatus]|uniref:mitochondrial ribosomal protein S18B isoform X2 n=1 Tax=Tachypleus tridentatus TaxID=6853 RepID=UPI003FCF8223